MNYWLEIQDFDCLLMDSKISLIKCSAAKKVELFTSLWRICLLFIFYFVFFLFCTFQILKI